MECDNCNELFDGEIYPVYDDDTGKKELLCWRCYYKIFLREADEEYKRWLREYMDDLSGRKPKPKPKPSFWERFILRKG